jgi:hypothetical protein
MNPKQSQLYDLGRQARIAGYELGACNLSHHDVNRVWWVAGWHDEGVEREYKNTGSGHMVQQVREGIR